MLSSMRTATSDIFDDSDELLTTGEAAQLLNASRQHVIDLCERGDLPFVTTGTHRRVRRGDVQALATRTQRLTRDQQRSLWLGYAVAGRLVADPRGVLGTGRRNLERIRAGGPRGKARLWVEEWERLLDGPIERILEALTSKAPRYRELRQNSPFAGVLSERERHEVLDNFARRRDQPTRGVAS
jgi:excisionase family DNA binding protein